MAKSVITIPATKSKYMATPLSCKKKRKVAAYARVSTDHEEQQSSYEAQVDYYTTYIQGRDDWEFVSVYADEGITGCNTKKRDGFNSMVEDALAGKIDLIITKSVSRFARNTVDSLTTIRKLKEHGTECYFEKENIWTFDGKGELLLMWRTIIQPSSSREYSTEFRSSWRSDIPVRTATAASALFQAESSAANAVAGTARRCGTPMTSTERSSGNATTNSTGIANAERRTSPRMRYGAFS